MYHPVSHIFFSVMSDTIVNQSHPSQVRVDFPRTLDCSLIAMQLGDQPTGRSSPVSGPFNSEVEHWYSNIGDVDIFNAT